MTVHCMVGRGRTGTLLGKTLSPITQQSGNLIFSSRLHDEV